jgi:thiamine-monophosphate kinase
VTTSSANSVPTLGDLGEFALLQQVVLPALRGGEGVSPLGDDCAFVRLPTGDHELVVTTDVAPRPLAWHLGHQSYRTWGWYAVVVNVSDLAAAGAAPLVITTSVEAPPGMAVDDFKEFFEGMAEASRDHGIANGGGNVRDAPRFACHGTAIGVVPTGAQLRRSGARPDDFVVAVGECGRFGTAYVRAKERGFQALSRDEQAQLCRPRAYANEMQILHSRGLVSAASDDSDGVLGALWNIAEASGCSIELDMSPGALPGRVAGVARELGYNPWNLMFFWGGWQVIVSVPGPQSDEFWRVAKEHRIPVQRLGRTCEGPPRLVGLSEGRRRSLRLLRNENFLESSFGASAVTNVEFMLRSPLWA